MTTIEITNNSLFARGFVHFAKILPFTRVVTKKQKSFEEESRACNAISLEQFQIEMKQRIKEIYAEKSASSEAVDPQPSAAEGRK